MNEETAQDCWRRIGIWGDRTCPELKTHVHCRNCPAYGAGASRLLDVEVTPEYLAEHARRYALEKERGRPGEHSIVVFRLGAEWLALPTAVFREIRPLRPVHSLPHRGDRVVRGVTNIRGELLVCVSLAAALGLAAEPAGGPGARLAVLCRGGDRFVFAADEIAALHRYDDAELSPVPATLAHAQEGYARGLLAWQGRAVGVLDGERLFRTLNRSLS